MIRAGAAVGELRPSPGVGPAVGGAGEYNIETACGESQFAAE